MDYNETFICACNGLKCDGICREQHLFRPRTNWPEKYEGRCAEAVRPKNFKKK